MLWVEEANGKDYVDLYFILKRLFSFQRNRQQSEEILKNEFNEKFSVR